MKIALHDCQKFVAMVLFETESYFFTGKLLEIWTYSDYIFKISVAACKSHQVLQQNQDLDLT